MAVSLVYFVGTLLVPLVVFLAAGLLLSSTACTVVVAVDKCRPSWVGRVAFVSLVAAYTAMGWQIGLEFLRWYGRSVGKVLGEAEDKYSKRES